MEFKTFLIRLDQIINEFLFLNSYFNTKEKSRIFDYDMVFSRWKRDMFSRFREMLIHMHWATSSELISENQMIMNVFYRLDYHFEIHYQFGKEYPLEYKSFLNTSRLLEEKYTKFQKNFDWEKFPTTSHYEKDFYSWKKSILDIPTDISFDLLWDQSSKKLIDNPALFNIIYGDFYLLQIKTPFGSSFVEDEPEGVF